MDGPAHDSTGVTRRPLAAQNWQSETPLHASESTLDILSESGSGDDIFRFLEQSGYMGNSEVDELMTWTGRMEPSKD